MFYDFVFYTPMYVTFFWSITLLLSKNNIAKFYLGVFMTAAFFVYLSHAIYFKEEKQVYLYVDSLYVMSSLLVYPLYYNYIRILSVDTHFNKRNLILFVPGIVIGGITLLIYLLMSPAERAIYVNDFLYHTLQITEKTTLLQAQIAVYYLSRIVFAVQVVYFLIKGAALIRKYNKRIENFYSNVEGKSIIWVKLLLVSFVITSVMSIIFNMLGKYYFVSNHLMLLIPSVIFSSLLFIIGLEGYMQNHSVRDLILDERSENTLEEMTPADNQELINRLEILFKTEKIYRNPELRIIDVSFRLNTNRTYISKIINQQFGCSFSDFVGKYRVEEAKELLHSQSAEKYTLEYISEKVGFGSLHSFIRMFKKLEHTTPNSYKKLIKSRVSEECSEEELVV